ncbi:hypothetical protein T05_12144, partial [Trichinella murrelli]
LVCSFVSMEQFVVRLPTRWIVTPFVFRALISRMTSSKTAET